jgi:uncharacterized membrane protein YtjA (UPF0391 family)
MLQLAILFLILAIVAGLLGYGGLMADFTGIGQILFLVFIVLFLLSAVASAIRGRPPV